MRFLMSYVKNTLIIIQKQVELAIYVQEDSGAN